jgi:exodeoxyribonuclease VII small subunit
MARPPKSLTDAPSSSDALGDSPASYEAAVAELEQLVAAMEGGQMPLDDLLDSYRRGAVLLEFCRQRLKAVEDQVKVLEDGQLKVWSEE